MKCKICNGSITWDNSFGKAEFLICENCYNSLRFSPRLKTSYRTILDFIFTCGDIIEDKKNKKKS
jgi:hypothetical protein